MLKVKELVEVEVMMVKVMVEVFEVWAAVLWAQQQTVFVERLVLVWPPEEGSGEHFGTESHRGAGPSVSAG